MPSIFLVLFTLFILFIFKFFMVNNEKLHNRSTKKSSFYQIITTANEQEYNPDINIKNLDLRKIRLNKFGRSQYKELTFLKVLMIEFAIFPRKELKFIFNNRN